jgi:hypothetical protein
MQQYVERMVQEKADLEGKIKRAKKAVENPPYGADKHGMILLAEQVKAMETYLACLDERIDYEKNK